MHPKKIRDISSEDENLLIDIGTPQEEKEIEVIQETIVLERDISEGEGKIISLKKNREIHLVKKKGKHFDALEKKTAFSSFFQMRNIVIKKQKRESHPLSVTLLLGKRYLQSLSKLGLFLLWCSLVFAVVFLGYLDKIIVENRVNAGYQKLINIREGNLSLSEIQKNVNNARFDLLIADTLFFPFSLFSGTQINSVEHVIAWGRYLSKALDNMLSLAQKTQEFTQEKPLQKIYFTQLFLNIFEEIQSIESSLETSLSHYNAITWLPSSELEEKRQGNIIKIEKILSYIHVLTDNFPAFLGLLGHEERKRYLIVFQNTDEIRPTGGFMGSMALLEVFRGQIQLFQKKDVYAIEWDLKKSEYERLPAPKWLNELTDTFWLRDANYYLNLKDSSSAIKFFTDRAGINIDGIIYINQNIILRLLEITGPIYFEALEKDINAENFSELMSLSVEAKTFQEGTLWTPKQVLFDFIDIFSQKLIENGEYFDYLQSLVQDVESRDIMVWSFHESQQKILSDLKLDGAIDYAQTLDFVYPVYTSLSGNKSDRYMKRKYRHTVKTTQSCMFDVNFEIQSTHDMGKKRRDAIESLIGEYGLTTPNLLAIQGAERNRQFVRIILPPGSIVRPQEGVEIVQYGNRNWVEFFLDTQLQETSFFTLAYTLPNPECKPYNYTFYKQAGIAKYDIIFDYDTQTYSYPDQQKDFFFEKR